MILPKKLQKLLDENPDIIDDIWVERNYTGERKDGIDYWLTLKKPYNFSNHNCVTDTMIHEDYVDVVISQFKTASIIKVSDEFFDYETGSDESIDGKEYSRYKKSDKLIN